MGKIYKVLAPEIHLEARFVEAESPEHALGKAARMAHFAASMSADGAGFYSNLLGEDGLVSNELPTRPMGVYEVKDASTLKALSGASGRREVEKATSKLNSPPPGYDPFYYDYPCAIEPNTGETTMSQSQSRRTKLVAALKEDGMDAGLRAGAAEFVAAIREPVAAALLREAGLDGGIAGAMIGRFLNTSIGEGVFSIAMGIAMPLVTNTLPNDTAKEMGAKLGKELRVAGEAALLRPLIRAVRAPLRDFVLSKIAGEADAPRTRVEASAPEIEVEEPREERGTVRAANTRKA